MANKADKYLLDDIHNIINNGYWDENPRPKYSDGTPAHTISVNNVIRSYDLSKGEFPITSYRRIAWKTAINEIFWIYQDASNDLNLLRNKYNIKYWDQWESKDIPGTIGERYGAVVRKYDLMNKLLEGLKNDPFGRRHIIDLYQYQELEDSDGLYPCAFLTIWKVRKDENKYYLDMTLVQRSGDMLTASGAGGINEVQYAALLMMVARHCGYEAGVFTHFVINEQIYDRHLEQAQEVILRGQSINIPCQPKLVLAEGKDNFYDFNINDFTMNNYEPLTPQLIFDLGI